MKLQYLVCLLQVLICNLSFAEYPIGTVLVSRNNQESLNTAPGYWNHLAIVVSPNHVIESQQDSGVILTSLPEYQNRDYTVIALEPNNELQGIQAAHRAQSLLGTDYRKLSSFVFARNVRAGVNCVSVIRFAYQDAIPSRCLRVPDDVFLYTQQEEADYGSRFYLDR